MRVRSCTSKFDHSRITLPCTIHILNSKYLNDDQGGREREVNTGIQERRHLPFLDREKRSMKTHTIYTKLYQTERRKKKVDISSKIFLSW